MSDEQNVDGAAEEQTEDVAAESVEGSQTTGLTEEQVEKLLQDRDKKWQSKFDKLLQEKKETETKSKTAEERIAEIERKYEQERLGRVRERAISGAQLDSDVVEAAQALLSADEESVNSGASKLSELLKSRAEAMANERIEAEIAKRFPKDKGKPSSGKSEPGLLSLEELREKSKDPQWVEDNEDLINKSLEATRG
jgi:hypothetical protein